MRRALSLLLAVLAVVVLVAVGQIAASESGEVVVLESYDAAGEPQHTRLWVVEDAGALYLRGGPGSGWVTRVLANGDVRLERDGQQADYRATPDRAPARRERVNALMRDKYGHADRFIALTIFDLERSGALPIRLEPR